MARLYAAMVVARVPIGIDGIATVLFLRHEGKSFGVAGAAAGALALGSALGAPFTARLIDRPQLSSTWESIGCASWPPTRHWRNWRIPPHGSCW